jgi:hypothetical protein
MISKNHNIRITLETTIKTAYGEQIMVKKLNHSNIKGVIRELKTEFSCYSKRERKNIVRG